MKQTTISRLVVGALATLAVTSSYAGQIQSSSVSIAREVITTNTQAIDSPSVSYRFNGDVDARVQTQVFQVQLKLVGGALWASAGTIANIQVTDGVDGNAWTQNATIGTQTYQVVGLGLSTDKSILFATIQVDTVASKAVLKQPLVSFSTAATKPTINNLFSVVKAIAPCDTSVYNAQVVVSHFTALSSPSAIAVAGVNGVEDEHLRTGHTNTGTLFTFPTNVVVKWTPSTGNAKVDVATSQQQFAGTTAAGWTSFISTTLANLGKVELIQNSNGYDSDLSNQYLLTGNAAGSGIAETAGNATLKNGNVEGKSFDVVVTPSIGFAVGSVLSLGTTADCASANLVYNSAALTSTTAAAAVTLSIPNTVNMLGFGTTGLGPVYVCYTVPGNAVIPGSAYTVNGTLVKAPAGAPFNEQNNSCTGTLYPLGGSVKIDVRNYVAGNRADKWTSVIRLINTSETRSATVYGQYIHADGKYGKWGQLTVLAPRAVLNMPAFATDGTSIDEKLTNAPAHATSSLNATAAVDVAKNPRLRITSPDGDTLRVQNYLFNPASQNFIEASSSQGVDFTSASDRAPASDGQYQLQDAQVGLNGGN